MSKNSCKRDWHEFGTKVCTKTKWIFLWDNNQQNIPCRRLENFLNLSLLGFYTYNINVEWDMVYEVNLHKFDVTAKNEIELDYVVVKGNCWVFVKKCWTKNGHAQTLILTILVLAVWCRGIHIPPY